MGVEPVELGSGGGLGGERGQLTGPSHIRGAGEEQAQLGRLDSIDSPRLLPAYQLKQWLSADAL